MKAMFRGQLAADASAPPAQDPAVRTEHFDRGFLSCRPQVDVKLEGDLVCMALGKASFRDRPTPSEGGKPAQAAAWLDAFQRHGELAPRMAAGRFSVVVVNHASRTAWAATDRFGTFPFCYAGTSGGFRFADRADSLPGGRAELSSQALFNYLFFHMIPAPRTVFEGVSRLPAGHVVTWRDGRTECRPYWTPVFEEPRSGDFEAARAEFLALVRQGVAREAAEGTVGAYLSGGTDSSTVSGMLGKVTEAPARTYSIGFDAAGYDEMEYARIAAHHFGTDHHEYYVTPADLVDAIPTVATHYDQPFGNSSAVPAWICARRAREDGVTKMLGGDGGDELFGGNTRYAKQRVFGLYEKLPRVVRTATLEPLAGLPGMDKLPVVRKGVSYVTQARVPMPDRTQMYNMLLRLGPENVFDARFLAQVRPDEPLHAQREVWAAATAGSLINRMLAFDWRYTLADNDLPKVIGTTQLAGVDVGFPLLTDELLAFSSGLPPEWKLRRFQLRWFFKEALRGFLPDAIITKKKHGFGLPFGIWVCRHDGLKALATDALKSLRHRGIVAASFIDELLDVHLRAFPGYYGEMVWILTIMELWMREHAPDWRTNAA